MEIATKQVIWCSLILAPCTRNLLVLMEGIKTPNFAPLLEFSSGKREGSTWSWFLNNIKRKMMLISASNLHLWTKMLFASKEVRVGQKLRRIWETRNAALARV